MYPIELHPNSQLCEHYPEAPDRTTFLDEVLQELQKLEDAYAEALGENADAHSLSLIWERIKMLKRGVGHR